MTSADMLSSAGHVLYGPSGSGWLRSLAAALNINERQIRRWLAHPEDLKADHGVFDKVEELLRGQKNAIDHTLQSLKQWRGQASTQQE